MDFHFKQAQKFLLVGLMNTLFGYSVFVVAMIIGLPHGLALVPAYLLGVCFNFYTNGKYVFKSEGIDTKAFVRFLGVYIIIYLINLNCINVLVEKGISPMISQALLLPFIAIITFLLFKKLVYRES